MNHPESTDQYMVFFVGYDWDKALAPDEARAALDRMMSWYHGLLDQGIGTSGGPLARKGKIIAGKNGSMVADGPFAEAKEVVGGYVVVKADSLDAATKIAQGCPLLEYGVTIDLRAMVNECDISKGLRQKAELANA